MKGSVTFFCQFMDGYCSAFDVLLDGAWFQACHEGVRAWNEEMNDNLDEYEGVMLWLRHREGESSNEHTST